MVNYRRARSAGATYCFTVTLRNRRSGLLVEQVEALRNTFREVLRRSPFVIDAIVVLPDHLHTVWTLPEGDSDFSGRWRYLKGRFTHLMVKQGSHLHQDRRGEYNLWQRRFWEHLIRDENDLIRHVDYIHYNPVKHGLVKEPVSWRWSSMHRYIRRGLLTRDWAIDPGEGEFGE